MVKRVRIRELTKHEIVGIREKKLMVKLRTSERYSQIAIGCAFCHMISNVVLKCLNYTDEEILDITLPLFMATALSTTIAVASSVKTYANEYFERRKGNV
jgi:hypothetical protein